MADVVMAQGEKNLRLSSSFGRKLKGLWKFRVLYAMLLPGLLYYAVYRYGPMYGAVIAFKNFNIQKGILGSSWADPLFQHFQYFFRSPYFEQLLRNTMLISLYKLVWGMPCAIFIALLLNEVNNKYFKSFIQTLSYLPHFLSWVIVYGIVYVFLSETSGLINMILKSVFGGSVSFLSSPEWFRSVLIGSELWKDAGWDTIIYIAAISGMDLSLYEAAKVDGASRIRMIWHITLPGIRNVIIMMLILKIGHIMDAGFEQIYIMYDIQVYSVADIIDTWVYRTGLEQLNFSLASAVGLFKSLIGLVLVYCTNKLANKWGEAIW